MVVAAKASHQAAADHGVLLPCSWQQQAQAQHDAPSPQILMRAFLLSLAFAMEHDAQQLKPILANSEHIGVRVLDFFPFLFFLLYRNKGIHDSIFPLCSATKQTVSTAMYGRWN